MKLHLYLSQPISYLFVCNVQNSRFDIIFNHQKMWVSKLMDVASRMLVCNHWPWVWDFRNKRSSQIKSHKTTYLMSLQTDLKTLLFADLIFFWAENCTFTEFAPHTLYPLYGRAYPEVILGQLHCYEHSFISYSQMIYYISLIF